MKERTHLPPISSLCDYYSNNPGSLDYSALNNQLPNKMTQSFAYQEITKLSETIISLQKENKELMDKIYGTEDTNSLSDVIILEQKIQKFKSSLKEKDKELAEISKCLDLQPNLIELRKLTRKQKVKLTTFDTFTSSILISNDQKQFFKSLELERQNQELNELIQAQDDQIRLFKARQSLYLPQKENSISIKFDNLNKNQISVNSFADKNDELDLTIQILQSEFKSLIKTRKSMTEKQKIERNNLRLYRIQYKSALMIQRVFRGFLARKDFVVQKESKIINDQANH